MKNKYLFLRKLFYPLLAIALLISLNFPVSVKAQTQTFTDVLSTDWYFQAVENGIAKKYIASGEKYRPTEKMRRGETAKMLTLFAGYPLNLTEVESKSINFKDVPPGEWFTDYVKVLVSHKIITGYLDEKGNSTGYFGPADYVTRNQTAALLNRILKLNSPSVIISPFKDLNSNDWAYKDVMALYKAGIIKGYADKTYRGDTLVNRAEMAEILDRAYKFLLTVNLEPNNSNPPTPEPELTMGLNNESISFPGPEGLTLTGRLYKPEGKGPFPAVVFMHGCSGLLTGSASTDYLASQYVWWGEKMAHEENIVALFVDSFTARNIQGGVCADGGTTLNEATERPKDAYAGLNYLRTLEYIKDDQIGLLGWSNGGSAVLSSMAKNNNPVSLPPEGGFTTAIAEYPGCGLRSHYGTDYSTVNDKGTYLPYAPVMILGAEKDTTTPAEPKCTNLVNRAKELGSSQATHNQITLTIYQGAQHSFDGAKPGSGSDADLLAQEVSRNVIINELNSALKQINP